jgi:hypothetical protein
MLAEEQKQIYMQLLTSKRQQHGATAVPPRRDAERSPVVTRQPSRNAVAARVVL